MEDGAQYPCKQSGSKDSSPALLIEYMMVFLTKNIWLKLMPWTTVSNKRSSPHSCLLQDQAKVSTFSSTRGVYNNAPIGAYLLLQELYNVCVRIMIGSPNT